MYRVKTYLAAMLLVLIVAIAVPTVVQSFAFDTLATVSQPVAQNIANHAKAATLLDFDTGTVVFEKNVDARYPIASMVKIMTLVLVYQEIDKGNLDINSDIAVSQNAADMGGSQAFLDAHTTYKADDLIKSIVVASANDACVALAEHIAGTVEAFVKMMNSCAADLGMNNTNFANCTGLPDPNGYSSAKDVGIMMRQLVSYSLFFRHSTVWTFDFLHNSGRTTTLTNTNKLVKGYRGCDGGKTGFTKEAQYCLASTAKRGDTRLISVVMGVKDSKTRNLDSSILFNFGFGTYETKEIVKQGQDIQTLPVARGKSDSVGIVTQSGYKYFYKKTDKKKLTQEVQVTPRLCAPISRGKVIGQLNILADNQTVASLSLITTQDIPQKGFVDFLNTVIKKW